MRNKVIVTCLALACTTVQAAPTEISTADLKIATMAVLSYGGFVTMVQRDCLPAKPSPKLQAQWMARHKAVLASADAFAEGVFVKASAKEGGRKASELELAYAVGQASSQMYRDQVGDRSLAEVCPSLVSRIKAGEFDGAPGRGLHPYAELLSKWTGRQKTRISK